MSHLSYKKLKKLKIKKMLLREGRVSEGSSYRESTVQKAFSPYIAVSCNNIGKVKCGITASAGVTRIHLSFFSKRQKSQNRYTTNIIWTGLPLFLDFSLTL